MNIVARIKFSSNLKNSSSAIGCYSYTIRYVQIKMKYNCMDNTNFIKMDEQMMEDEQMMFMTMMSSRWMNR
jgi:hypothetical protein